MPGGGHNDMDTVLLSVRCGDGKETEMIAHNYGSSPAHSVVPAAEVIIPTGMAGVQHPIRD